MKVTLVRGSERVTDDVGGSIAVDVTDTSEFMLISMETAHRLRPRGGIEEPPFSS
jgi:hypothetical protein